MVNSKKIFFFSYASKSSGKRLKECIAQATWSSKMLGEITEAKVQMRKRRCLGTASQLLEHTLMCGLLSKV